VQAGTRYCADVGMIVNGAHYRFVPDQNGWPATNLM
jgi:hypothetical protein